MQKLRCGPAQVFEANRGTVAGQVRRSPVLLDGKFRASDLDEDIRPDAVLHSIADLPGLVVIMKIEDTYGGCR